MLTKKTSQCRHTAVWVAMILTGAASISAIAQTSAPSTVDSIEFVNQRNGHYYRTDVAAEIAQFDQHVAVSGWARTGQSYKVWRTQAEAPAGAIPLVKLSSYSFATPANPQLCSMNKIGRLDGASGCAPQTSVSYVLPADASGNCASGTQPVYQAGVNNNSRFAEKLSVYQDMFDRGWKTAGVSFCVPGVSTVQDADIYRLLKQATFGPTETLMLQVKQQGINAWLDNQLNMAAESSMPPLPYYPGTAPTECTSDGVTGSVRQICSRDSYTYFQLQLRFFQNALKNNDQLRQRVAFALSQILVTSGADGSIMPYGMARYQQTLLDYAFGNYRDLLSAMTLSPVMGDYLNMANSNKPDPARGISANENFAREILQLFSIGLYELNLDGTVKKDASGNLIPSYNQTTVENFARVFTGWTYANQNGAVAVRNNPAYFEQPMVPVQSNHDVGTKTLFNGYVVPANMQASQELELVLNHLFAHPNVAPFISKQLIQKLVTGDPSPAYVERIARIFNNNGQGIKGDLKAVVRAILLDIEARGAIKTNAGFGKLKEPALLALSAYRALEGVNDGVWLRLAHGAMGQDVFRAPTVFNYYVPDNTIANGKLGPEFEILNSTTVFARLNFLNNVVFTNYVLDATVTGATGTTVNWAPWQALANNPAAMVEKMSWLFTAGALSTSAQQQIVSAVNAVAATDTITRARTAAYLILTSSQFQVDR